MRLFLGRCAAILTGAAVIIVCSCEKHHVGEIPEVQKEHSDPAAAVEAGSGEVKEKSTSEKPAATASATPTPAEFFSPAKP